MYVIAWTSRIETNDFRVMEDILFTKWRTFQWDQILLARINRLEHELASGFDQSPFCIRNISSDKILITNQMTHDVRYEMPVIGCDMDAIEQSRMKRTGKIWLKYGFWWFVMAWNEYHIAMQLYIPVLNDSLAISQKMFSQISRRDVLFVLGFTNRFPFFIIHIIFIPAYKLRQTYRGYL